MRNQTGNNNRKYSIGIKCAHNDSDEYNDYRTHTGTVVALKIKNPTKQRENKKEKKRIVFFFLFINEAKDLFHINIIMGTEKRLTKHIQSMMKEIANS